LQDSKSGLAAGAKLKYGWSESTSTAPSSYTDVTPSYTAGTTSEVTFTASASGLTGKYYLWVVPTTLADKAGNSQTATVKSTGQFYFDNQGPSAPTITGGSTTYATSRTISVSTAATDANVGTVSYYQYYLTNSTTVPTASTEATASLSAGTTSKTFNTNYKEYYIYFRGVDSLGNKGIWSSAQRLYIDINSPTITANNASITIDKGTSKTFASLFTVSNNGNAAISSTVYTLNNATTSDTNTSSLEVGTHTLKCTVTKVGGKSANANVTIKVNAVLPSTDTELTTWAIAKNGMLRDFSFTVPEGVTKVKLTGYRNDDPSIEYTWLEQTRTCAECGGVLTTKLTPFYDGEDNLAGYNYKLPVIMSVTPGKTYTFKYSGGKTQYAAAWTVQLLYSSSINNSVADSNHAH